MLLALTFDVGLQLAERESPDFYIVTDNKEAKVSLGTDMNKDLVASGQLFKGYEHPIIIDATQTSEISSRSSSQLIKIFPNLFFDMLFVFDKLLKHGEHSCKDVMSRESRPKIAPYNFSSLVGKFCLFNYIVH